jgi:hypothetical protein
MMLSRVYEVTDQPNLGLPPLVVATPKLEYLPDTENPLFRGMRVRPTIKSIEENNIPLVFLASVIQRQQKQVS